MSDSEGRNGGSDTPDRRERLELYNGEFEPGVALATGFQDAIEPVDEAIDSMADATGTAHKSDDTITAKEDGAQIQARAGDQEEEGSTNGDQDRGIIVNAQDMNDDLLPQKKRKKKTRKPASKRGLVSIC